MGIVLASGNLSAVLQALASGLQVFCRSYCVEHLESLEFFVLLWGTLC